MKMKALASSGQVGGLSLDCRENAMFSLCLAA